MRAAPHLTWVSIRGICARYAEPIYGSITQRSPPPMELVLASPVALISIITLALLCGVGSYMVYHFLKHAPGA